MTSSRTRSSSKPSSSIMRRIVATWVATIGTDCAACGIPTVAGGASTNPATLHKGHVTSAANGGSYSIANLLPICARCNAYMGERDWTESGAPMLVQPVTKMVADPGPVVWDLPPWA